MADAQTSNNASALAPRPGAGALVVGGILDGQIWPRRPEVGEQHRLVQLTLPVVDDSNTVQVLAFWAPDALVQDAAVSLYGFWNAIRWMSGTL